MSIIYDALKKVENSKLKDFEPKKKTLAAKKIKPSYIFYALIVIIGFFTAKTVFRISALKQEKSSIPALSQEAKGARPLPGGMAKAPLPSALPQVEDNSSITLPFRPRLEGILYDHSGSYAIVNKKILRPGDTIRDLKLLRIFPDRIELESSKGEKINLTTED